MKKLPTQQENFPEWYNQLVVEAGLADYGPVRGTMIIKPYGYAIWERIQTLLNEEIKKAGVQNMYFPMFIPQSFLQKEASHIEGFAPEVAVVTHAGGKKLDEPLVIRPTSETIIYDTFAKWIQSYRDLPLMVNQWANVVRWEMRTRLFLRTSEFLWQEGHTAHASREEAAVEVLRALSMYQALAADIFAMKVIPGHKTASETFAGAEYTTCIEGLMRDKKALQMGTSHFLGQHFSQTFGVSYLAASGQRELVFTTSWGVSTRLIGGLIMAHGDDAGLILPPRIAPYEVVIIPIWKTADEKQLVLKVIEGIISELEKNNHRLHVDWRENLTPGFKYNDWEMKGVPLRMEVGPKDVQKNQVVLVRRDNGEKMFVPHPETLTRVHSLLEDIQNSLLARHTTFVDQHTFTIANFKEFKTHAECTDGFLRAFHCGQAKCEASIKEETKATARVIPFTQPSLQDQHCVRCNQPAKQEILFAKAY